MVQPVNRWLLVKNPCIAFIVHSGETRFDETQTLTGAMQIQGGQSKQ